MSYTIQSSEKLRKSGADMETKALLYLMNFRDDSNEIYYFIQHVKNKYRMEPNRADHIICLLITIYGTLLSVLYGIPI